MANKTLKKQTKKSYSNSGIWINILGGETKSNYATTWVSSAVACRAENVAGGRLTLYKTMNNGEGKEVKKHPFIDLTKKVNIYEQSFYEIIYLIATSLDVFGKAYVYIPKSKALKPAEFIFLNPANVNIVLERDKTQIAYYEYRNNGKAGIIVPEGIIFKNDNSYKKLRKMLVENYVWGVVSLPAKIFEPYSGVKTSILLIDKKLSKNNDNILFVKVENDGFDLGAQRKPIEKNDLPEAKKILMQYKDALNAKNEFTFSNGNVLLIEKSKIAEKGVYNLTMDRYRMDVDIKVGNYEMVRLENLYLIERGGSPRPIEKYITTAPDGINWIKIGDAKEGAKYIYKTKEKIIKEGVQKSRMVYENDFILSNSMSFGRPYIMKTSGCVHDGWLILRAKTKDVNQDYLYNILSSENIYKQFEKYATGGVVRNLNISLVKNVEIPVPPIAVQLEIVNKIEGFQSKIQEAKEMIEENEQNIKDEINKVWEK